MDTVAKIQDAEQQIADLQSTLEKMQNGLQRAEAVAVAAEDARRRSELLIKVSVGVLVLSILAIVFSRRRPTES